MKLFEENINNEVNENIVDSISSNLLAIKNLLNCKVSNELLYKILFEMNRYFDTRLTDEIQLLQTDLQRVFNQKERNLLRRYYYYKTSDVLSQLGISDFVSIDYNENDVAFVLNDCISRCKKYGSEKIINSIKERKSNIENNIIVDNSEEWLNYHKEKVQRKYDYSVFVLNIDQEDFIKNNYSINPYFQLISSIYDGLENYRHLIIIIRGILRDQKQCDITWKLVYKIGLYCENFVKFSGNFFPFKKEKSINKLSSFLDSRFPGNNNRLLADNFYANISYGFKYEDCYIADGQESIILTYKKIELDDSPIPCPSCMTTIQSGNSYPEMFLRSYECKNPNCPERSKSGRGKRFDEYSVYRYFKLIENKPSNDIGYALYNKWRRDVFPKSNDIYEMLFKYYAWDNEKVCVYPKYVSKTEYSRHIIPYKLKFNKKSDKFYSSYEDLPIVLLMRSLGKLLNRQTGHQVLRDSLTLINEDSSTGIRKYSPGQVGAAITSPPYYNAREYSQWENLIMYLIDMMINGASVYDTLQKEGYYLYNIGDIVNSDNIYVHSNMSKRRLQLGFQSCMFFELVGFNLVGNIIWDKGQVQSKRNSTVNLNSGYVKCINCYEHVFILKKGNAIPGEHLSYNSEFTPVIKINSKGENTYKHTAPFPPEMVGLLRPFIVKSKYILDPFVGSGTTLLWCKENGVKAVGYELNSEYFKLCHKRIFEQKLHEDTLFKM